MSGTVTKEFKTVNRCFSVSDPVEESDIEGALSFEQWASRGFIADAKNDNESAPKIAPAAPASKTPD